MSRIGQPPSKSGGGVTDHTLLTNIGTTTHANIDIGLTTSGARVYSSTTQGLPQNAWTQLAFNTESFDTNNEYGTATYNFVAANAGLYIAVNSFAVTTTVKIHVGIYTGGALYAQKIHSVNAYENAMVITALNLAAGGTVQFYGMCEAAGTATVQNDSAYTFGCITRVR